MTRSRINQLLPIALFTVTLAACSSETPTKEDTPELITKMTLTFSAPGQIPIMVTATDPDGEGVQDIVVDGPIVLPTGTTYTMSIELINGLVPSGQPGYDITQEVEEEGEEHQFFFAWTDGLFSDPAGDGNIDNGADAVNYAGGAFSKDDKGLNLGLTTTWTTGAAGAGTFRVVLKHQPGTKTTTSGVSVGETDLDLSFTLEVL